MWKKEKVLVTVKTYPNLSHDYDELVCTAGLREDGSWIRLYPIPFRALEYGRQFRKYQWIEIVSGGVQAESIAGYGKTSVFLQ